MLAVLIGYDIPEALDTKWKNIMPGLNEMYKSVEFEGDIIHLINDEADIHFIQDVLVAYNTLLDINLTLDVFKVNESLLKF